MAASIATMRGVTPLPAHAPTCAYGPTPTMIVVAVGAPDPGLAGAEAN